MSVQAGPEGRFPPPLSGLGLAASLMDRPTIILPIAATAASRLLVGGPVILAGLQMREAASANTGIASATDTDVDNSSGNVANAAAVATLPGVAGQTTFITGFEVTATGSTAVLIVLVTVAGILGGTKTYEFVFPAGVTTLANPLVVEFSRPIPASAVNTAITVTLPAGGAGNTNAAATAHGFQRLGSGPGAGASAAADLLNGVDTGGELAFPVSLGAGGIQQIQMGRDGPFCSRGVFLNVLQGTIKGAVWVKL
jgi:hypothetical protein